MKIKDIKIQIMKQVEAFTLLSGKSPDSFLASITLANGKITASQDKSIKMFDVIKTLIAECSLKHHKYLKCSHDKWTLGSNSQVFWKKHSSEISKLIKEVDPAKNSNQKTTLSF